MRATIAKWYRGLYLRKRIIVLGIPDVYVYDDPALMRRLENLVGQYRGRVPD